MAPDAASAVNTRVCVLKDSSKLPAAAGAAPVVVYSMNTPVEASVQPARPRVAAEEPAAATELVAHVAVVLPCPDGRVHVPVTEE